MTKVKIKTAERRQGRSSGVFIVNSGHISHFLLVFLLLTLNKQMLARIITCRGKIDFKWFKSS